jgi:uncharacterized cupredoxin-like copper-binding protein
MSARFRHTRRIVIAVAGAGAIVAGAVPALAATTVKEKLTNFKISGGSSAKAGKITFRVSNAVGNEHELVVIRTSKKAGKLKTRAGGKASESGKVGEVEVKGRGFKTLTVKLKKGHYALICNVGDHYKEGMYKDFTVK